MNNILSFLLTAPLAFLIFYITDVEAPNTYYVGILLGIIHSIGWISGYSKGKTEQQDNEKERYSD